MIDESVAGQEPAVRDEGKVTSGPLAVASDADGTGGVPDYASNAQLPPEKMALLTALVENSDMRLAAKAAGISHVTACRWLKDPTFHQDLARQRNDVFAETMAAVKSHATQAVCPAVLPFSAAPRTWRPAGKPHGPSHLP